MTPYQFARDHFLDIARKILGEPNPARSNPDEWRWGTNGSLALIIRGPKAGAWKDFETDEGGGPWQLLRIKGQLGSNDACRAYLEREFGFDGNDDRQHIIKTYVYTDEQG